MHTYYMFISLLRCAHAQYVVYVYMYVCAQHRHKLEPASPVTFIDGLPFYDRDQPYFSAIRAIYPHLKLAVTGLSIGIKINRFVAILFRVCNMADYYHIKLGTKH